MTCHTGGEPVGGVVGSLHDLVLTVEPKHRSHWAEDLFPYDAHLIFAVRDDGRFDEVAFDQSAIGDSPASEGQRGAVCTTGLGVKAGRSGERLGNVLGNLADLGFAERISNSTFQILPRGAELLAERGESA